jgi:hypothetical protein
MNAAVSNWNVQLGGENSIRASRFRQMTAAMISADQSLWKCGKVLLHKTELEAVSIAPSVGISDLTGTGGLKAALNIQMAAANSGQARIAYAASK